MKKAFLLSLLVGMGLAWAGCADQDVAETTSAPFTAGENGAIGGPSAIGSAHTGVGGGESAGAAAAAVTSPGR